MRAAHRLILGAIGMAILGATALVLGSRDSKPVSIVAPEVTPGDRRVVGLGRIEPESEEVEIGVEVPGRVIALLVDEGDVVRAGQTIAVLENRVYRALVALTAARLAEARAFARKTHAGSRADEIEEARAAVAQAHAVLTQATREATRRDALLAARVIAREERDRSGRDVDVAAARLRELQARLALVEAGPRVEERDQADSAVTAAAAALSEARARLAKTEIRSPIDGTVLRRRVRVGETLSPELPGTSLFNVANLEHLRVRVEVDEQDVARVAVGQAAYVTAPAYGTQRFRGTVSRVGRVLGRKRIRTDEARERVDTKVLEVLVDLQADTALPVGLRVDATISPD
jgi:HlyD family secretion protein